MSSHLLRRSLLALGALLLATGGCGPGPVTPPPIDDPVAIRVIVDGPGRVTWGPTPLECYDDCSWQVPGGGDISVNAIPATGNVFANWDGVCDTLPNPCRRTFRDGDTITATFAPHALRLDLTGDGTGTFSIDVYATCDRDCAVTFSQALTLGITVQPTSGTILGDWTGPCDPGTLQPSYCQVHVSGATDIGKTWALPPAVTSVSIDQDDTSLEIDETLQLTVTVTTTGGASQTVTWNSSDDTVASITNDGLVTALTTGTTTITATSDFDDSKSDSINIDVTPAPAVTSVSIDQDDTSLEIDETLQLTVTVTTTGGASQTVTWNSSDDTVASITNDGLVTALTTGTTTITATSDFDDTKSDSINIDVTSAPD